MKIRTIIKAIAVFSITFVLLLFLFHLFISWRSAKYIYDNIEELPENDVALVLGTSRYQRDGSANIYFYNRMDAVLKLYENNKISYILVSGDNRTIHYNEPGFMRYELLKRGIPDSVIYLDYAGFRTFDSVIRCHEVFGQNSFTIVSQKFHNQRAIFIARSKNLDAIAFNAGDIDSIKGFRVQIREIFARVKVYIDIITGKKPKFLGEPVKIGG